MNLIKASKGMRSGRKNQILTESIRFQERLYERMKSPDFPLMEKLRPLFADVAMEEIISVTDKMIVVLEKK